VEKPAKAEKSLKQKIGLYGKMAGYVLAGIVLFAALVQSGVLNQPLSGGIDVRKLAAAIIALLAGEAYLLGRERKTGESEKESEETDGDERTVALVETDGDCTVVLERSGETSLVLNLIPQDWQRKEISVRSSPFFIGKDATRTEGVIGQPEVSRVHAKVVMEENAVYLIDQESTNGTYLNGSQLVPWERCRLKDGDMVGFASVFYRAEILS
jgi:hypothetical protein